MRSVAGINPEEYGVADTGHAWRIHRAMQRADHVDDNFFRKNIDRRHRIRASIPFERAGWNETSHDRFPLMLVRAAYAGFERRGVSGFRDNCPDDEAFCRQLFDFVATNLGDDGGRVPPLFHAQFLNAMQRA